MTFWKFLFALFTVKLWIIHENAITFLYFSFENEHFTLLSSSSSSIYNIVITMNTPTTMNNQFEAINALKNRFSLLIYHLLCAKTTSLSLSLYIHPKNQRF